MTIKKRLNAFSLRLKPKLYSQKGWVLLTEIVCGIGTRGR
jgi:hypothetical protein